MEYVPFDFLLLLCALVLGALVFVLVCHLLRVRRVERLCDPRRDRTYRR